MESILIKVSSFGLNESYLGKTLKENYDNFIKIVNTLFFYIQKFLLFRKWIILLEKEENMKL